MAASETFFDNTLLRWMYVDTLLSRSALPDFTTPEWRAWAAEWREEVPLTREQKRENAEWRERVVVARERLKALQADYLESVNGIGAEFGVKVVTSGEEYDSEYGVDDYDPPHKTTYRTKDGAPAAPPQWKTVTFGR